MAKWQFLILSLLMLILNGQEVEKPDPREVTVWITMVGSLVFSVLGIIEASVDYWNRKKGSRG